MFLPSLPEIFSLIAQDFQLQEIGRVACLSKECNRLLTVVDVYGSVAAKYKLPIEKEVCDEKFCDECGMSKFVLCGNDSFSLYKCSHCLTTYRFFIMPFFKQAFLLRLIMLKLDNLRRGTYLQNVSIATSFYFDFLSKLFPKIDNIKLVDDDIEIHTLEQKELSCVLNFKNVEIIIPKRVCIRFRFDYYNCRVRLYFPEQEATIFIKEKVFYHKCKQIETTNDNNVFLNVAYELDRTVEKIKTRVKEKAKRAAGTMLFVAGPYSFGD